MRSSGRRTMGGDGMGLAPVLGIVVAVLVMAGVVGLTVYGGSVQPASTHIEQVVPDDRLPH